MKVCTFIYLKKLTMKRIIDNLVYLKWIWTLIKNGILTPVQGRFFEGAVQTLEIGIAVYIYNGLDTMDFSNWKVTAIALGTGFLKTLVSWILYTMRTRNKDKQEILDTVLPTNPTV